MINNVVDNLMPTVYKSSIVVFDPNDTDFILPILRLEDVSIVQSFSRSYADHIYVSIRIENKMLNRLMKHYQGLRCKVNFKFHSTMTDKESKRPRVTLEGRVILKDMKDLMQQYAASQLMPEKPEDQEEHQEIHSSIVNFELIDDSLYQLRKRRTSFILRDATIEDAIRTVAVMFGIDTVDMVPPDNKKVYKNFRIPPLLDMAGLRRFFQESPGLGIYNKGAMFYFSRGTLHVYPYSDVNPKPRGITTHVYLVPAGKFDGLESYHMVDEEDNLHILANRDVKVTDATYKALENVGSATTIMHNDRVLNDWVDFVMPDKVEVGGFNYSEIGIGGEKGITEETYTPTYSESNNNTFVIMSNLSHHDLSSMSFSWAHSEPFRIKPGHKFVYHYSGQRKPDSIKLKQYSRSGICRQTIYSFSPKSSGGIDDLLYGCNASVILDLDRPVEKK